MVGRLLLCHVSLVRKCINTFGECCTYMAAGSALGWCFGDAPACLRGGDTDRGVCARGGVPVGGGKSYSLGTRCRDVVTGSSESQSEYSDSDEEESTKKIST